VTTRDDEKPSLGRGWRKEHLVVLRDLATGEDVPVWTGLTPDPNSDTGRLVDVIAYGDGPTLRLGANAGQLRVNIKETTEDLAESERRQAEARRADR
jgi:hypothetical protein